MNVSTAWQRQRLARLAQQAAGTPTNVPSPCVSVCRMNADTGWCEGCLRDLGEIANWAACDDAAKRHIWSRIAQRLQAASS
jgi:predicted Fe-S protein YdhL (DUF1289 family)